MDDANEIGNLTHDWELQPPLTGMPNCMNSGPQPPGVILLSTLGLRPGISPPVLVDNLPKLVEKSSNL